MGNQQKQSGEIIMEILTEKEVNQFLTEHHAGNLKSMRQIAKTYLEMISYLLIPNGKYTSFDIAKIGINSSKSYIIKVYASCFYYQYPKRVFTFTDNKKLKRVA
jgi:hypothetical protein